MQTNPPRSAKALHERRPAIWPWLVAPLIALMLFFTLRSFRQITTQAAPAGGIEAELPGSAADPDLR